MTTASVAPSNTTTTPKFTMTGNSIEEMAKQFAELIAKTEAVEVVASKKGSGQYGKWELGVDGEGIPLRNRELALKAGAPLFLGMTIVWRKLTDPAQYDSTIATMATKTTDRIARLKAQLASLESK